MAYPAVISLKQTIQRLLISSHISIVSSSREILEFAYQHLTSLQQVLRKSDESNCSRKILDVLEEQIRETSYQLEDVVEYHASNQILSREEDDNSPILPPELDMMEVSHKITSFVEDLKKMERDYSRELNKPFSEDVAEADAAISPTLDSDEKIIGLCDVFTDLKDHLMRIIRPDEFGFFSFYGLAGIGRSVVARTIYDDIYIGKERSFDCGAWARIGSTYELKEILLHIISEINGPNESLLLEGEEKLSEHLYGILKGRRYIVALDDIRDTDILVQLRRSFPEQNNGSMVFVTTSLMEVALFDESFFVYEIPSLMDEDWMWNYIRGCMFGSEESISEFEDAGKKIVKNCGGRRLVLARIMLVLWRSNMRKIPEFWKELAAAENNVIFMVEDEIFETDHVKNLLRPNDKDWSQCLFDFSIAIERIKSEHLYPERLFSKMGIMTIYGMAGIGKTALTKKLFKDPSISQRFDQCVWINVGLKYKPQQILADILAQIDSNIDKSIIKEDAELAMDLSTWLADKKCLIVLDDLWSQEPVHDLKRFLPNIKGELMVTTRQVQVGVFGPNDRVYKLRLLNDEESWDHLREKVFGEEPCPHQLEKAGKMISEKCEGLPLLILEVAKLLFNSEKTLEYWNEVATKKNLVFKKAHMAVSKVLYPSYEGLPQHLKSCFLYLGVFPENSRISTSDLMKLWFAEGFLEPYPSQTFEDFASECLKHLLYNTMIMVKQGSDLITYKTCALHSIFWHLSNIEATKTKFFHTLNVKDDTSVQCRKSQRRLCIRNSIIMGTNDVYDATDFSSSRALLCTGPYHQYQVSLYLGSRLLIRVLDALAIRFYEFPIEVETLIFLRYLALTCSGNLPSSISKLWNLQFLIVRQHFNIKSSKDSSFLPNEIWDMKELRHLQVAGSTVLRPNYRGLLPNLSSLLDVSFNSCTKSVFKSIPNLRKLGIQIELMPDDDSNVPFQCFNHISYLHKLESLKCDVVNPEFRAEVVAPPFPPIFPPSLIKLSLCGLGFPWEYMSIIGKLQNLEVLKLRCYAFLGPAWEIDCHDFPKLKNLSIEDTDLVCWDARMPSILNLQSLSIKHCYNLEQLPSYLPNQVKMVEVVDSHPLATNWANHMKEKNWKRKMKTLELRIQSSWSDENLK